MVLIKKKNTHPIFREVLEVQSNNISTTTFRFSFDMTPMVIHKNSFQGLHHDILHGDCHISNSNNTNCRLKKDAKVEIF